MHSPRLEIIYTRKVVNSRTHTHTQRDIHTIRLPSKDSYLHVLWHSLCTPTFSARNRTSPRNSTVNKRNSNFLPLYQYVNKILSRACEEIPSLKPVRGLVLRQGKASLLLHTDPLSSSAASVCEGL